MPYLRMVDRNGKIEVEEYTPDLGTDPETREAAPDDEAYDASELEYEARTTAARNRIAELTKSYGASAIDRAVLVRETLRAGAELDLQSRNFCYDLLEFRVKEHFCELWEDDHDCFVRGSFTQLDRSRDRDAWLEVNKEVLPRIRALLGAMPETNRREVSALFSKPETQWAGLNKLDEWEKRTQRAERDRKKRKSLTHEEQVALVMTAGQSARAFSQGRSPEVQWALRPFIAFGTLVDLHGPPKEAGKSTLVSWWVRALIEGGEFLGERATKTRVLWFTEQPRATFNQILTRAGLCEREELQVLSNQDVLGISWEARADGAIRLAERFGARVLIIDTLAKLAGIQGEDENKSGAMLEALSVLQPALAMGIAVILVRHDRKGGGSVIDSGRGSNAIAGDADAIFGLTKPKEGAHGGHVRRLQYEGRLEETPSDLYIELTPEGYRRASTPNQAARAQDRKRILGALPAEEDRALSASEIAERLGESERTINRQLAEMRSEEEADLPPPGVLKWTEKREGRRGRPTVRYYRPATLEPV